MQAYQRQEPTLSRFEAAPSGLPNPAITLGLAIRFAARPGGCYTRSAMDEISARPILLISARRQTRALLAAELGERVARDVIPAGDANAALGLIKLAAVDPAVMVVDAARGTRPEDVERLLAAKRKVPLVLIVSGLRRGAFDGLRERSAAYLVRPVSIGSVAGAIVETLEGQGGDE